MGVGNPTISRETETQVPAACQPQPRQPHIIKLISQLQKTTRKISDTWIIDTGKRETRYRLVKIHQTVRQPHIDILLFSLCSSSLFESVLAPFSPDILLISSSFARLPTPCGQSWRNYCSWVYSGRQWRIRVGSSSEPSLGFGLNFSDSLEWNLLYKTSLSGVTSTTLIAKVWCKCVKKDPVYWEGGRERKKKNVVGDREPGSVIDDLPEFFEFCLMNSLVNLSEPLHQKHIFTKKCFLSSHEVITVPS